MHFQGETLQTWAFSILSCAGCTWGWLILVGRDVELQGFFECRLEGVSIRGDVGPDAFAAGVFLHKSLNYISYPNLIICKFKNQLNQLPQPPSSNKTSKPPETASEPLINISSSRVLKHSSSKKLITTTPSPAKIVSSRANYSIEPVYKLATISSQISVGLWARMDSARSNHSRIVSRITAQVSFKNCKKRQRNRRL